MSIARVGRTLHFGKEVMSSRHYLDDFARGEIIQNIEDGNKLQMLLGDSKCTTYYLLFKRLKKLTV